MDCLPSRIGYCSDQEMHTSVVDPSVQLSFSLSSLDASLTDGTNTCSATHIPTQTENLPVMSTIAESHYPCAIIDDIIVETSIATMESELPARVLPSFNPVSCLSCAWGALSGHEFSMAIDRAYSETIGDRMFSRFHQELVESVLSMT